MSISMPDFLSFHFKEKYQEDSHFADGLMPKYQEFEIQRNQILKPKYPSITDEMKRQMWISKKIKLKTQDLEWVVNGLRQLIGSNFEHVDLINDENAHLVKYLTEKKTQKIYKVTRFNYHHYHYSTITAKAILSVKFDLKNNFFKNKVIIKYSQGYLAELAFSLMTYGETRQQIDAKLEFNKQAFALEYRLKKQFGLLKEEKK